MMRYKTSLDKGVPFWAEEAARRDMERSPLLRRILKRCPADLSEPVFNGQRQVESSWSSYKDHGYGRLFYFLVREIKPAQCVELGVLQGFSLLTTAGALRDNGSGKINGYDLFEDYPFHNAKLSEVQAKIDSCELGRWASIERADAFTVCERYESADMLHVDLSNNGDTFRKTFADWSLKVKSVILFEGGGRGRDKVEWMIKYDKPAIVPALEDIRRDYPQWEITVFEPFPSLTVAIRKNAGEMS